MPADITGLNIYSKKEEAFVFVEGPIMTNILLADEINRATPRTQSALLEAMQEEQVTVDGTSRALGQPFMVIATQNPIETVGTFPLPEAQLDRFFMRMSLGYMSREEEIRVLSRPDSKQLLSELEPVVGVDELIDLQKAYPDVQVKEDVAGYIMDLVSYTRNSELLNVGVSTRGALALYRASQIYAAVNGRDYVIPEDVKTESSYVLPHRLMMTSRSHMDVQNFIRLMLDDVSVPLEKL